MGFDLAGIVFALAVALGVAGFAGAALAVEGLSGFWTPTDLGLFSVNGFASHVAVSAARASPGHAARMQIMNNLRMRSPVAAARWRID
jgi:hypothetical protein